MGKPNANLPDQHDMNCLAAFIEATEELKREPFFSPDDKLTLRQRGKKMEADFGDRFHFRSALITFRKMWLGKEASNFLSICKLIKDYEDEHCAFYIDNMILKLHENYAQRRFGKSNLTGKEVVDLWLNAVFVHSNISRRKPLGWRDRIDFHNLVKQHGATSLEFICRSTVKAIGSCYFNLLPIAKSTLSRWEKAYRLRPAFEIGSPFGREHVELNADGYLITRKPSSEHLGNETNHQKLERILARYNFESVRKVLEALEIDRLKIGAALVCAKSYPDFLNSLGYAIAIDEAIDPQAFCSQLGEGGVKAILPHHDFSTHWNVVTIVKLDKTILTTPQSLNHFDQQLTELQALVTS